MTGYWRLYLGKNHAFAQECFDGGFIGTDYDIDEDLTGRLPDQWRDFNDEFIPKWLAANPGKSKIAAGLSCGMLWTVSRGYEIGDRVLCPIGGGVYRVGEVTGPYQFVPQTNLPHRRPVKWLTETLHLDSMSEVLQRSVRSMGTSASLAAYAEELSVLISGHPGPKIIVDDATVEDPSVFAMERHLEDFLIANWAKTPFGRTHTIFEVDGVPVGQQYPTDTGPLDILAVSNDGTEILVLELKKGRASDAVVGQIQRYMGFVQEELANTGQRVRGAIIALDDDLRLRRALSVVSNIDFYRYEVSFTLNLV